MVIGCRKPSAASNFVSGFQMDYGIHKKLVATRTRLKADSQQLKAEKK